jgi:hypothetical protein
MSSNSSEWVVKGFFIGFIVAQFISGWISGPLIVIVLLLYVFAGEASRKIGAGIMAHLPVFVARKLMATPDVAADPFSFPVQTNPDVPLFTPFAPVNKV